MLAAAFIETPDYIALTQSDDFNLVVGRRGTGKSAIFAKLREHYRDDNHTSIVTVSPQEHETMELQRLLHQCGSDYRNLRAISRLAWRAHLLMVAAQSLAEHYRVSKTTANEFLVNYVQANRVLVDVKGASQCTEILKFVMLHVGSDPREIPSKLAGILKLEELKSAVDVALRQLSHRVIVAYDGLDEGWEPETSSTAILGGLALATADLVDANVPVRPILFVRDNMFRALANEDNDFTRHIEGNTLRLHWNEESLFHLVAMRLRAALRLEAVESDVKIWNRFAHRELKNREGFARCLHYTLYRPRDILVLLNDAYVNAAREGRDAIIDSDVESSSKRISQTRVDDLLKEYDVVLPGLGLFINSFRGSRAIQTFSSATTILDAAVDSMDDSDPAARDFALFGSGREIFFALYSVGVFGVLDPATDRYVFCHDGSASTLELVEGDRSVAVHPCYWKALDLQADTTPEAVLIQINDDYDEGKWNNLNDVRTKRLGTIIEDLSRIDLGHDGHVVFEKWVLQASKMLFTPALTNIQLKPNPGSTQQRDCVATNTAGSFLWKRILQDYSTRQVIFECKNYEELEPDDFRQALSYLTGEYGRFAIMVTRAESELPAPKEKAWVRTMWHEHKRLILILPADLLARCIRKLRNPNRRDYAEDLLSKRMDTFVRSYLGIPSAKRFRKKRPKAAVRSANPAKKGLSRANR